MQRLEKVRAIVAEIRLGRGAIDVMVAGLRRRSRAHDESPTGGKQGAALAQSEIESLRATCRVIADEERARKRAYAKLVEANLRLVRVAEKFNYHVGRPPVSRRVRDERRRHALEERDSALGGEHGLLLRHVLDLGDRLLDARDRRLRLPAEGVTTKAPGWIP